MGLDEAGSAAIRREVVQHLDTWAALRPMPKPGDPRTQRPTPIRSPEFPIEVRMLCGGRLFALTTAQASMPVFVVPSETLHEAAQKGPAAATFDFRLDPFDQPFSGKHTLTKSGIVGCTVSALLPGFVSDVVTIAPDPGPNKPFRIGPIIMHKTEGSGGNLIGPTFWSASEEARGLLNQAGEAINAKHDFAGAAQKLQGALALDPHYAQAWVQLAGVQDPTDLKSALASYRNAIAADPNLLYAYSPLLRLQVRMAAWQDVIATATQLLKLCPHGDAEAWYDLAFAADQSQLGPQAADSVRKGIADDPFHVVPELERLYARILSRTGDSAGAAEHLRNYLQYAPDAPDTAFVEREISLLAPAAAAQPASGRTVADLVSTLRAAWQARTADNRVAKNLHDFELSQRLDDRTVETLESEGAGPQTAAELLRLRDQSMRLPRPPAPAIAAPAPPSNEEQERIWTAATQNALTYSASLPDFICTQEVRRYRGTERPYDTLRLKLTYFEGKEDYQLVTINGKTTKTPYDQLGGATTRGEFASELTEVFAAANHVEHRWDHWTTLRQRPARVYYFRIPLAYSPDRIESRSPDGDRLYGAVVSQQGYAYVDAETNRVVRLTWETEDVPIQFQIQSGSTQLDYGFTAIGGGSFLVPLAAEIRVDSMGEEYRNGLEFRDYRKFAADSSVTFGEIKK